MMPEISDEDLTKEREQVAAWKRSEQRLASFVIIALMILAGWALYGLSLLPSVVWKYAAIAAGLATVVAILFLTRKILGQLAALIAAAILAYEIMTRFPSATLIAVAIIIAAVVVASAVKSKGEAGQSGGVGKSAPK
jgi:hypothetical protein